jgi:hypothetical protein
VFRDTLLEDMDCLPLDHVFQGRVYPVVRYEIDLLNPQNLLNQVFQIAQPKEAHWPIQLNHNVYIAGMDSLTPRHRAREPQGLDALGLQFFSMRYETVNDLLFRH